MSRYPTHARRPFRAGAFLLVTASLYYLAFPAPEFLNGLYQDAVYRVVTGLVLAALVGWQWYYALARRRQNDIGKAIERLAALQQKLRDRAAGLIKRGRAPTVASVEKQCERILSRQHLKQVITTNIREGKGKIPELEHAVDSAALSDLADTHLGKNIIITNRASWDDAKIIEAYRSQFIIENVFKEMKDRTTGSWWPMNHWTDSKIGVHGLYCTIALLLRALMLRRVKAAKMQLSMKRLLSELDNMRQVINIFPKKRRQKTQRRQAVLSRTSELQDKLIDALGLKEEQNALLG